ncbi:MAG: hypothetical protein DSY76_02585 [Bacteroidetes bacterium]|nr:MAG: hypothetical protein DSY76_02585 [Bacteroidota bacterium]
MLLRRILFFLLLIFPFVSFSQTGPAGVGSSTNNVLWLRSNDIGQTNNTNISSWTDQSGNSNNITQPSSTYQPLYITNQQNGYPVVRFASNERLRKTSFSSFPTSAITVFMVNKNSDHNDGTFSYASSSNNNDFLIFNSANYRLFRGGAYVLSSVSGNNNAWHIINVSWQGSDGATALWKDGSSAYTGTLASGTSITSGGCLAIAGEQDAIDGNYDAAQAHDGDFLEIIVYNTNLNSAQKVIIANYLAAKYNLTISNDFYAYQGTHSYEVAGIGRFDASNTHTAAMSSGILQIENPSSMTTDGEYLIFGHDNGSISSWTATEAPSVGNIQRIAREWRLDETGSVGTIDFKISNTNLPALNSGYTKYAVMVDADGDFTSGAAVYELTASGSDYVRTGISISDGDYVSIAAIKPTIEFAEAASSDVESSNATIQVDLNYNPASAVTVDYTTADGTATAGSDYTAASGSTLTISAGSTSNTFTITVSDDATQESDETFTVSLSNPSSGINIGSQNSHTYTIIDNDNSRKVNFDNASANGSESTTSVSVGLNINTSDAGSATTVDYSVTGGTATGGGVDYTLASGTVTFPAGTTTTGSFNISINNDALDEDNETIIITLSNPSNCNLGTTKTFTYTINDDDPVPSIQFTTTSSSGSESTASVNLQLTLSAVSSKDVDVSFSTSGTATNGSDYTISSSPATITAGNTTTNISLSISDDAIVEIDETVVVTISSPVNATLGSNTSYTYTIQNDDTYGYDGPGGVGKAANLKLWVKAEDIPGSSDGDLISSWADQSGNGNNLIQSTSSYQPAYYDNVVNTFPVARFYQSNSRLIHNSYSDFPDQAITSVFVNKSTGQSTDGLLSYASSASDNDYLIYNSANVAMFRGSSNRSSGISISTNTWNIVQHTWQNSDDACILYTNGTQRYSNTLSAGAITQNGCLAVAAEQDAINGNYASNQAHAGDFTEIILYNFVLPTTLRNIVNSYLAAKYDISTANDKYAGDDAAKGDYDFEVIGIGTESDGMHDEAHGSGGLWIKQNANFGNGDYLMIGHNHITPQLYTPTEDAGLSAASIQERWARDWYFDITDAGSTISVNLTFDFTEAEMNSASSPTGTASNYKLLYRSGTSGNWAVVTSASSISSSQVVFNAVSLTNGDGYYALGTIDKTNSPLPIELLKFDANLVDKKVELSWTTASETNNDFFSVERSSDANQWEVITKVKGQGNSNEIQNYKVYDMNPLPGTSYYRLTQTDFDGKFTHSDIRVIHNTSESIHAYPNPVSNELFVESTGKIVGAVAFSQLGKEYKLNFQKENQRYIIDMSRLSKGVYFLRLTTENSVETIKVIRQ